MGKETQQGQRTKCTGIGVVRVLGKKQQRWSSFKGHTGQLYLLQMEINKAEMQEEEDVPQSSKAVWQEEGTEK